MGQKRRSFRAEEHWSASMYGLNKSILGLVQTRKAEL